MNDDKKHKKVPGEMLSDNEVQIFSDEIAKNLSADEDVELLQDRSKIQEKIVSVISENMAEERKINADCDKILDQHAREIDRGSVDPHMMFLMIKKKLAKERGFIL